MEGEAHVVVDVATLPSALQALTPEDRFLLLGCTSKEAASLMSSCVIKGAINTNTCDKLENTAKFPPFEATALRARVAAWE